MSMSLLPLDRRYNPLTRINSPTLTLHWLQNGFAK